MPHLNRSSLSTRLNVWLTAGVAVLWLAATVVGGLQIRTVLNTVLDSALQETAQRLLPLAVEDIFWRRAVNTGNQVAGATIPDHDEYLTYQVKDATGMLLLRSHDAPEDPFPVPLVRGFSQAEGLRIYTESTLNGEVFIHVAEPLSYRNRAILESSYTLLLPLMLMIPLSIVGIALIVRYGLRPVHTLQTLIERRSGKNLAPLADHSLPREFAPIAGAVDRLLERLRAALDTERAFAANSAHELRTPIATALAQTQRLIAELHTEEKRERAGEIHRTLERLGELTEKLLQLSRADAGVAVTDEPVDLLPVLFLVVEEFQQMSAYHNRLFLRLGAVESLPHALDMDAFGIVLRNLVENALNHGDPAHPVTVSLDNDGTLHVVNRGKIIPPEALATLKTRFTRGQTTATGSGLGLAIADAILTQVGGRLELHSPALGQPDGFEAIIRLA